MTWVFEQAEDHDLTIDWGDAGPMLKYEHPETGEFFTLGQLNFRRELSATNNLFYRFEKLGLPVDACLNYPSEQIPVGYAWTAVLHRVSFQPKRIPPAVTIM